MIFVGAVYFVSGVPFNLGRVQQTFLEGPRVLSRAA